VTRFRIEQVANQGEKYTGAFVFSPVAAMRAAPRFVVERFDNDGNVLGPNGWQVSARRGIRASHAELRGDELWLYFGPLVSFWMKPGTPVKVSLLGTDLEGHYVWPPIPATKAAPAGAAEEDDTDELTVVVVPPPAAQPPSPPMERPVEALVEAPVEALVGVRSPPLAAMAPPPTPPRPATPSPPPVPPRFAPPPVARVGPRGIGYADPGIGSASARRPIWVFVVALAILALIALAGVYEFPEQFRDLFLGVAPHRVPAPPPPEPAPGQVTPVEPAPERPHFRIPPSGQPPSGQPPIGQSPIGQSPSAPSPLASPSPPPTPAEQPRQGACGPAERALGTCPAPPAEPCTQRGKALGVC
jgi:hypothetical protein